MNDIIIKRSDFMFLPHQFRYLVDVPIMMDGGHRLRYRRQGLPSSVLTTDLLGHVPLGRNDLVMSIIMRLIMGSDPHGLMDRV